MAGLRSSPDYDGVIRGFFETETTTKFSLGLQEGSASPQTASIVFNGTGSLSVAALQFTYFNGTGSLSVVTRQQIAAFARFRGVGDLFVTTIQTDQVSAVFNGTGSLSAVFLGRSVNGSAQFNGTGSLSVLVALNQVARAEFDGMGSLSVIGGHAFFITAQFNGTGSLTIGSAAVVPRIVFNGMGHMCIEAQVRIGHGHCGVLTANRTVSGPGPTNNAVT